MRKLQLLCLVLIAAFLPCVTHASSNSWGRLLYTHYASSPLYHAPLNTASVRKKLSANEVVKADFRNGKWVVVFKPSEQSNSMANAVGYMLDEDLFPEPLPPGPIADGVGEAPPVAYSIEQMTPLPPPSRRSSFPNFPSPAERSQAAKKAGPAEYSEGTTFVVGYTGYRVSRSWWSARLSENEFLNQPPDAMYLFVEILINNADKKERMIPPFNLVDNEGREHGASTAAWAVEGSIGQLTSLNPGVTKSGFIVFDVPRKNTYKLKVSGGFWSGESAIVKLQPR